MESQVETPESYFGIGIDLVVKTLDGSARQINTVTAGMGERHTADQFMFSPEYSIIPRKGEVVVAVLVGRTYLEHVYDEHDFMTSHASQQYRRLLTLELAVSAEQSRIAVEEGRA